MPLNDRPYRRPIRNYPTAPAKEDIIGIFSRKRGPAPGTPWAGPVALFDGVEVEFRPGPYALTEDGKHIFMEDGKPIRLTMVVEPTGTHHYVVAGKTDPPVRPGNLVIFEGSAEEEGTVAA